MEDEEQEFLTDVLYQVSDVSLIAVDFRSHIIQPDLGQMLYDLNSTGEILLELRSELFAKDLGAESELTEFGERIQDLARHRFSMGSSSVDTFGERLRSVSEQATRLKNRVVKRLNEVQLQEIEEFLERDLDSLEHEWKNAERYRERGELGRLWDAFRRIGFTLNRLGNLPEPRDAQGLSVELRNLAEKVRGLSSYQRYFLTGRDPLELLGNPMKEVQIMVVKITRLISREPIDTKR